MEQSHCGECPFHLVIPMGKNSNQAWQNHRCKNPNAVSSPNLGVALLGKFIGEEDFKPGWCPLSETPPQAIADGEAVRVEN